MNQEERIAKNNQELVALWKINKKSLSLDVLKRYLSEEEIEKLLADYASNLKTVGAGAKSRKKSLEQPLTNAEMEIMTIYITEVETPVKELEKRFGLKQSTLRSKAQMYAVRYLHQNKDIVGL